MMENQYGRYGLELFIITVYHIFSVVPSSIEKEFYMI